MTRHARRLAAAAFVTFMAAMALLALLAFLAVSSDGNSPRTIRRQPTTAPTVKPAASDIPETVRRLNPVDRVLSDSTGGLREALGERNRTATDTTGAPVHEFAWPADGSISQGMTGTHPTGIDIRATTGEPIRAVRAGRVTFASGDRCCQYGYHVIIEHDDGWSSLYAHLSVVSVKPGDRVEQGQLLGLAGDSGKAQGVHLHFELWSSGERVNPLNYLMPPRPYIPPSEPASAGSVPTREEEDGEATPDEQPAAVDAARAIAAATAWMEDAGYVLDRASCFALASGPNWSVSCAAEPQDCTGVAVCESYVEACVVGSKLLVEATCSGY